jgi:hypothetical protein
MAATEFFNVRLLRKKEKGNEEIEKRFIDFFVDWIVICRFIRSRRERANQPRQPARGEQCPSPTEC